MVDIARQPVIAPGIPYRTIGLALLLIGILLAAASAFVASSRPNLPVPFGPARNGLVAYAADGDIFTVDPVTHAATAVVTGPETDLNPRWSRDGTRFVFERKVEGNSGPGQLYIARSDGSDLARLTPEPLGLLETYAFSPDGREVLLSSNVDGIRTISIAKTDGSGIHTLDVGMVAAEPVYRPIDGAEIGFLGFDSSLGRYGVYLVNADGSHLRTLLDPSDVEFDIADLSWSPDGSRLAYTGWISYSSTRYVHVISTDGTEHRILEPPPGVVWEQGPVWSNDGKRLLILRGYTYGFDGVPAVVLSEDGAGPGLEIAHPSAIRGLNSQCCPRFEWAPDDSSILATPVDTSGRALQQVLWDPVTGASRPAPWTSSSHPTWQRLAP